MFSTLILINFDFLGTNRFDETDLKKIFRRFGTVVKVDKFKQKNFSFIQFEDE